MDNYSHFSVLLNESINALEIKKDGIYVDATLGGGGHSLAILEQLDKGHLYAFDQDVYAIAKAKVRLKDHLDKVTFIKANFANIKQELLTYGVNSLDGVIYDLGVSSFQLDIADRGFSYRFDSRLDMRMDKEQVFSAFELVNNYSEAELTHVFLKGGAGKFSRSVARNIVKARNNGLIETTFQLIDVIKSSLPNYELNKKGHPAKVFFQALRMEVNQELAVLETSLNSVIPLLKKDGVLAAITFQPLEDELVMKIFKNFTRSFLPSNLPIKGDLRTDYVIQKAKIKASKTELDLNNRSHSARLRVLKRVSVSEE